ncbi:MAG: glycosyltransferase family 4 protein [Gemmatimonadota bacterium]|nr:MAG: glycosyltransferase family 4 protein [Gemmatimonadota bacterium]
MTSVVLVPDLPIERWPSMDRYASRLAAGLERHEPELEVSIAGKIASLTVDAADGGAATHRLPPSGVGGVRRYLARYWTYPRRVRRLPGDVMHVLDHSYGHVLLRSRDRPAVVTVHDLLPLITVRRGARSFREWLRNWLLERVLEGVRRADAWIVGTEWLEGELGTWLERRTGIHVVPFGVDDAFFEAPAESRDATRVRWGLPENAFVVLHVGSVGERKNIPTVIAAVAGLRSAGVDAWLLQVGGTFTGAQRAELAQRGIQGYVRAVGEAAEPDLRAAYRASDLLLFPSKYEGFGFPVLEAMASGVPAVCSGAGGLSEVAGDAAVVVGGRETKPYVNALRRLAEDRGWREELVARGRERAARYRWAETARQTAEVYRSLV